MAGPMPTRPIPIRFPPELLERLDAYVERERRRGIMDRSDAVRKLLAKALDAAERSAKKQR
jgi:metal-responsive CopG/Arc/MetJ family transcriptional regulator